MYSVLHPCGSYVRFLSPFPLFLLPESGRYWQREGMPLSLETKWEKWVFSLMTN